MSRIMIAAVAATALLAACSPAEPEPQTDADPMADANSGLAMTDPAAAQMAATPAADFVRMAGASDLYEIQSSEALLETTQNAELRRFAQMMIDNHGETTSSITAAARSAGLTPGEPALDAAKTTMVEELRAAEGPSRDMVYVTQQVTAHEQALALHRAYARDGDQPALKAAAASAVPVVERHLADIRRIRAAM